MSHERLKLAINSVWKNGCVIYRERYCSSKTHIQVFNPFWECILEDWFITGATDQQCEAIEKVMKQWLGEIQK